MKQINNKADVGTYIITRCSKCNNDMNHVVVAKGSDGIVARVKCIVCNSEHNYHPEKNKVLRTTVTKTRPTKPIVSGYKLFEEAKSGAKNMVPIDYAISNVYKKGDLIQHINWGEGVVYNVFDNKVEVIFRDMIRALVHNRK